MGVFGCGVGFWFVLVWVLGFVLAVLVLVLCFASPINMLHRPHGVHTRGKNSGVNACQSEAVACKAVLFEISHKIAELQLRLFVNAPTSSAHSWVPFAHMGDDHHCHTENSLPAERNIVVA